MTLKEAIQEAGISWAESLTPEVIFGIISLSLVFCGIAIFAIRQNKKIKGHGYKVLHKN